MSGKVEHLGTVSCPSGTLLIFDGGCAALWSHDRPPLIPQCPAIIGASEESRDLAIRGPDALVAGRALDRSGNPLFVFDQSPDQMPKLRSSFEAVLAEGGLDASLEILDQRVSHRRRVDLSLDVGGGMGVVDFHGMTAIAIGNMPCDRPLSIGGEPMPEGPDAGCWRCVWIEVRDGEIANRCTIGDVAVDQARLMAIDADVLGLWEDAAPFDGKADVVFWGRDGLTVAQETQAEAIVEGSGGDVYGWLDLPVGEAHALAREMWALRSDEKRFAVDFRPHTNEWAIMREVRKSPTSSGGIELGGAQVCMVQTSWGDGVFPVQADLDAEGHVLRIRIDFSWDETDALLR